MLSNKLFVRLLLLKSILTNASAYLRADGLENNLNVLSCHLIESADAKLAVTEALNWNIPLRRCNMRTNKRGSP